MREQRAIREWTDNACVGSTHAVVGRRLTVCTVLLCGVCGDDVFGLDRRFVGCLPAPPSPPVHDDVTRSRRSHRPTGTACKRAGASGPCSPGGHDQPPFSATSVAGVYKSLSMPFGSITLRATTSTSSAFGGLSMSAGPVDGPLQFSNTSAVLIGNCSDAAAALEVVQILRCTAPQSSHG